MYKNVNRHKNSSIHLEGRWYLVDYKGSMYRGVLCSRKCQKNSTML